MLFPVLLIVLSVLSVLYSSSAELCPLNEYGQGVLGTSVQVFSNIYYQYYDYDF